MTTLSFKRNSCEIFSKLLCWYISGLSVNFYWQPNYNLQGTHKVLEKKHIFVRKPKMNLRQTINKGQTRPLFIYSSMCNKIKSWFLQLYLYLIYLSYICLKVRKSERHFFYRVKQRHHYQQYQQYQLLPANYNLDNTCRTFKFN